MFVVFPGGCSFVRAGVADFAVFVCIAGCSVGGGKKYVRHNLKYVRHILKYLRDNSFLLREVFSPVRAAVCAVPRSGEYCASFVYLMPNFFAMSLGRASLWMRMFMVL